MSDDIRNATVPIAALKPHPRNYRRHPEQQLGRLAASVARFGQVRSIVVQEGAGGRYLIVAGHGLAEAAKREGLSELRADIIPADWTPEQVEGYLIADNMPGADDDAELLATILQEQANAGYHLESLGYDADELDALLAELTEQHLAGAPQRDVDDPDGGGDDFDTTPDAEGPTRCQSGDLWQLGAHRLLCGDSTKREDVARLMDGETAQMVWSDPPYGMNLDTNYDAMFSADTSHRKTGHRFHAVRGDDEAYDPRPLMQMFASVQEQFWWGADYYANAIPGLTDGVFIVWDKRCSEEMDKVVGNVYEMAWSRQRHRKEIARVLWSGHHGMQYEDERKRVHPTQKPLALLAWFFARYGNEGDIVVDPYCGSGPCLIAAERLNRRCYGIEIDPRYCDVILRRWEAESGREATLLSRQEEVSDGAA